MHWQLLFATASVGRAGDVALEIESRNAKAYAMMAEAAQNLKILANRMLVHAGVDASSMQRSIATAARSFENVGRSDYPPAHDVVAELPAFSIPTLATEPASPASYNAWAAPPIAEPAVMLPPAATATATAAVASAYTSLMSTAAPAATAPTTAAAAVPTAAGTGTATPTANRLGGDRGSLRVPIVSTACGSSNDESHKVGRCDFVSDDKPETRWSCGSKGSDCWVAVSFGTAPHTLAALQIDFESANSDEYVLTVATSPIDASRPLDATWILVENHHNDGDWYRGAHQLDEFNLTPARTAVYGVRLQHVSGTYESNSIWQIRAFSTPLDIVAKPKEATEPVDAQCRIGHQTPFALCAAHRVANGGGTSYKYDHRQPRASQTGATSHPIFRKIDGIEGVREEAARAGSGVEIVAEMPQGHWVQTQMYDGQMFLRYLPDRKNAICSWASNHPLEWHPALGCPGAQAPYSQQKCGNVAAVVKVKCAYIAGQGQCGASCAGTVHDEKRWFHRDHSQQPPLSCNAKKGARYWPKLAATMSVNPTDVGHFVPQVVPRIIIMNASVPEDVLITVITTPLVERYLGPLFRSGALDKKRFLLMPQEKMNDIELHGGEVYQMYNSHFQHLGSGIGEGLAVHKAYVPHDIPFPEKDLVVLIDRGSGSRSITNQAQLVSTIQSALDSSAQLRRTFPKGLKVYKWKPDAEIENDIEIFNRAAMVLSPHGAGLSNIVWCSKGTPVLEICYDSFAVMQCPNMYWMLAVSYGLEYWFSLASGSYGSPMTVDVGDIKRITITALEEIGTPKHDAMMAKVDEYSTCPGRFGINE